MHHATVDNQIALYLLFSEYNKWLFSSRYQFIDVIIASDNLAQNICFHKYFNPTNSPVAIAI